MRLAQGHNKVPLVGIKPRTSRFGVGRSTTTPPRSPSTTSLVIVGEQANFRVSYPISVNHCYNKSIEMHIAKKLK